MQKQSYSGSELLTYLRHLFQPFSQVLTGTKTFSQDIDVDTFSTRNKQVATRGKTPFSAASAFDDSNYVLRSDRSATINNNLIAEGKITLASAQVLKLSCKF